MTMSAKLAATALALALVPSAFAAGAAHADASKSTWKNATAKASHKIAVEVGLVPDSSSPVKCTRTLLLRQDKRVALTWISPWGADAERNGVCGDRTPLPGPGNTYTSGYLSLKGADDAWTPIVDMAAPECTPLERQLVDAGLDVKAVMNVIDQVVRLSPLQKCKLTIIDKQTPWRTGSAKKARAVATDVGAAPIKDFPDRCYSVSLLRADSRVAILYKTKWGAKSEQYETCGAWERYSAPIAVWDGTRWQQVSDTYTGDCQGLRTSLQSYGVPSEGIDEVISVTLGGSTGSCS